MLWQDSREDDVVARQIDKLVEYLEDLNYWLHKAQREARSDKINERYRRELLDESIPELNREIKTIERKIVLLEDCEHADCEDTGGPDGSRQCLDCGKVW
jgi:hypothetical protein